jgi:hypothetical protein
MRRIIEYMWMVIAAISLIELIVGYRQEGYKSQHFQLFAIIFITATFMFFLRKRQRKFIEKTKAENNANPKN